MVTLILSEYSVIIIYIAHRLLFIQAIWKKIQARGLKYVYGKQGGQLRRALLIAMALPFAPATRLQEGLQVVQRLAASEGPISENLHKFLLYVERNWIIRWGSRISIYGCPRRTNNAVESFHRKINKRFGNPHPDLLQFLGESDIILKN